MENAVASTTIQRTMMITRHYGEAAWAKNVYATIREAVGCCRHASSLPPYRPAIRRDLRRRQGQAPCLQDKPFCSLYIDCEHETIGEGGLPVFNYIPARWKTISGYQYAFSPATITSLPDGRMLQSLSRNHPEQGEKALDAPMYGKGEIFRMQSTVMPAA